jgi:hypothetical protein
MDYQVNSGAVNTGLNVGMRSVGIEPGSPEHKNYMQGQVMPQQPDTMQVLQMLVNNQGKLQALTEEFYRTREGQQFKQGMEHFKAYLSQNIQRFM